jgi:hypothetical protein
VREDQRQRFRVPVANVDRVRAAGVSDFDPHGVGAHGEEQRQGLVALGERGGDAAHERGVGGGQQAVGDAQQPGDRCGVALETWNFKPVGHGMLYL